MNTDKLWNVRDEIICELATATMKLDRLQVELSSNSVYETPTADEARIRILNVMDTLQRLGEHVKQLGKEIRKLESC
jgi:hypothetical protein